jgi:preprotein translocase subunit SecY
MIDAFSLPDLRRRILFTIGVLVVFRFIAHIPLPGLDTTALASLFEENALLGMLNMFSGGAMKNMSVAAMGVYPYITSSIIMTLLVPVIPKLQAISAEGESGKHRINMITHWLTVPLAAMAGYGQLTLLRSYGVLGETSALATIAMVCSLIAGTMFLVWLGELITENGIGNGISIIIFAGIIAGIPQMVQQGFLAKDNFIGLVVYLLITLGTTVLIVIFTEAHRRIPVQYAKSVFKGGRMYRQSGATHIPLRVNTAGMIPLIFAMSIVMFPGLIAQYFVSPDDTSGFAYTIANIFQANADMPLGLIYWGLNFLLVLGFAFFYTSIIFEQQDLPGVLQRQGGFIPGIRPGKHTKEYLDKVIKNITWAGRCSWPSWPLSRSWPSKLPISRQSSFPVWAC